MKPWASSGSVWFRTVISEYCDEVLEIDNFLEGYKHAFQSMVINGLQFIQFFDNDIENLFLLTYSEKFKSLYD